MRQSELIRLGQRTPTRRLGQAISLDPGHLPSTRGHAALLPLTHPVRMKWNQVGTWGLRWGQCQ